MADEDLAEYAAHQGIAAYPTTQPEPAEDTTPTVIEENKR